MMIMAMFRMIMMMVVMMMIVIMMVVMRYVMIMIMIDDHNVQDDYNYYYRDDDRDHYNIFVNPSTITNYPSTTPLPGHRSSLSSTYDSATDET